MIPFLRIASLVVLAPLASWAQQSTPKIFPPPAPTTWLPVGCRVPPSNDPHFLSREGYRFLHGDALATDELSRAIPPVMKEGWTAETATYNATGPVFDGAGNVYFSPLSPFENVVLISLDAATGARRWAIAGTGAPPGGSTPIVLADPDGGDDIIYLTLYDRALAVRADGTVVWDVETGLTYDGVNVLDAAVMGTNYLPAFDAIVSVTLDGHMMIFDRATGAALLPAPHELPGERSPDPAPTLPQGVLDAADAQFRTLVNLPENSIDQLIDIALGNDVEVANMFSIDPVTGRMWVVATAPDGEDGTVDGISAYGALYGLDLIAGGTGLQIVEGCRRTFAGGSATTPALPPDGSRVYVGDNDGVLIAVDRDCNDLWEVPLPSQIFGSIAVSSDNAEVYASTQAGIAKVVDHDTFAELAWHANLDLFNLAPSAVNLNLNLVAIGANGLGFQAGAGGILNGVALPNPLGVGVLDRDTGQVRSFVLGGEETIAAINTGPDGSLYLGNSPLRRIFSRVLGISSRPLLGGITKYAADRPDLLMRDAACAASARVVNAREHQDECPDSARADARQARELVAQARANAQAAIDDGLIRDKRWAYLDRRLAGADEQLALAETTLDRRLLRAKPKLRVACRSLTRMAAENP